MTDLLKYSHERLSTQSSDIQYPVKPTMPNDPGWLSEFSDVYLHPDNYKALVNIFFPYTLVASLVTRYFFGVAVHADERIPRYNKVKISGQWVDDTSGMAILGIRRGSQWKAANRETQLEIDRHLSGFYKPALPLEDSY